MQEILSLDTSGWSTPQSCCFTLGKDPVPSVQEDGWTTGPMWRGAKNLASHRDWNPWPSKSELSRYL